MLIMVILLLIVIMVMMLLISLPLRGVLHSVIHIAYNKAKPDFTRLTLSHTDTGINDANTDLGHAEAGSISRNGD